MMIEVKDKSQSQEKKRLVIMNILKIKIKRIPHGINHHYERQKKVWKIKFPLNVIKQKLINVFQAHSNQEE